MVIDDFTYDANVCGKGELGGTFKGDTLTSGLTGNPIDKSHDLDCKFSSASASGSACRWGSIGPVEWRSGSGTPNPQRWQALTGTNQVPDSPFAYVLTDKPGQAILVSDPINCQKGTNGQITFKNWVSDNMELKVCALKNDTREVIYCSPKMEKLATPGPTTVSIPGPIEKPFVIVFQV